MAIPQDEYRYMKEQMYRMKKEMMYQQYGGWDEAAKEEPPPAPKKPSYLNPKLLLVKG